MKKLVVLAVLLAAAALVLSTCSNPVDLLAELEVEVMKANDRYLEIENLDAARMGSSTDVSPSADVVVVFDRPVDGATLSGITLLENGTAVSVKTELNGSTLRVAKDPYFDNEKDYALTLTGVQGTDAAALLEPISWSFHTGMAPAANISVYSKSALSEDGYSDDALITVFIEANLLADKFIVSQTPLSEPYSGLIGWASLVSGQTEYDYTLTGGDGAKTLYVLLVDEGSEPDVYSVVTQRAIYLDTVAPSSASISVSYSGNDPTYVKGTQVVSSASADAVGIGKVEFRIGGTLVATDTEAPYTHNWVTTSGYANGSSYAVVARAYDRAGNYLDSTTVNRTVDNAAPTVSVAIDNDANYFNAAYVRATRAVTSTASDTGGVLDKVEFYVGGILKYTDTASPYSYSWNTTGFSNGTTYALTCKAFDKAGNSTVANTLNRTVDNAVPTVSSFAINGTGDGSNAYIKTTGATLSQSVSDGSPLQMRFSNDGTTWTSWASYTSSTAHTLASGDGTKYVYYHFRDAAGNQTTTGTASRDSIYLDTAAPATEVTSPTSGASVVGTALYVEAEALDDVGIWKVEFYIGGVSKGYDTSYPYKSTTAWNTTTLTEGASYTVQSIAYDMAGNSTSSYHSVYIDNFDAYYTRGFVDGSGSTNFGSSSCMGADWDNGFLYIAYYDYANSDIDFLRSEDDGASWTAMTSITTTGTRPEIAVDSKGDIHALYMSGSNIYYRKSTDAGASWSTVQTLATDASTSYDPAIVTFGSSTINVHVLYVSNSSPNALRYRRSADAGATFLIVSTLYSTANQLRYPKLSANGSGVQVLAQDYSARRLLYGVRNGTTGAQLLAIGYVGDTDVGENPSMAAVTITPKIGDPVHYVMITSGDGASGQALRTTYSSTGGATFSAGTVASNMSFVQSAVTASWAGLFLNYYDIYYVAYLDYANGRLLFGKSTNMTTWYNYVLDGAADVGGFPSAVSNGNAIYVSYYDAANKRLKFVKGVINF